MDNRALILSYSLGCLTMVLAFSIKDICSKYNVSMHNHHLHIAPELISLFCVVLIVYSWI